MAKRQIHLGSLRGAIIYDDANFPEGINTDGPLRTSNSPVASNDVIRNADVGGGGSVAPSDATYIVVSLDGDLSNERRLQAGTGLKLTDAGANGDLTVDHNPHAAEADLTDNTLGTPNDNLQALTDPADTPADADALRDDLVANLIPELRNNFADLASKVNAVLQILRDQNILST